MTTKPGALLVKARSWRVGALGRNTLLTASALVFRAGLQAAYLILMSRWLGAEGYGLFAGSVAAAVLLAPLSTWGMGYVFTERIADPQVRSAELWKAVVRHGLASGVLFALISMFASQLLLPAHLQLMDLMLVALAELVAVPMTQLSSAALLALDRGALAALATTLVPAFRLVGMLLIIANHAEGSVHLLVLSHCAGSVLGAALILVVTRHVLRSAQGGTKPPPTWRELGREGAPYAASGLTSSAYFEIDKVLILQFLGAGVTGTYTVAFRVVAVFILPVMALLASALPRMFIAERLGSLAQMLRQVTWAAFVYGIIGMLGLLALAPLVPWIFGFGFEQSASYVMLLAAWVPLYALHTSGANALVVVGKKVWRVWVEGIGLALVVVFIILLLPRLGAVGAIASLLIVEAAMGLACWLLLARERRIALLS